MKDEEFIAQCLRLAAKGRGKVSPNPMVGAVIVKGGKTIARGFHRQYGGLHAETEALRLLNGDAYGATLYVNLEPCSHYGKQPPCVESIVREKIGRVVVGVADPNPLVQGKGLSYLQQHGVDVRVGVLEEKCTDLNRAFFKHILSGLPWVTLKIAQSLDGRIAAGPGRPGWITSLRSRKLVHKLRSQHDAVLVGVRTAVIDDPELTVRHVSGRNPRRVVLDSTLLIPLASKLLSPSLADQTIIITTKKAAKTKISDVRKTGADVWVAETDRTGRVELKSTLARLGRNGVTSVLVEGGAEVFTSFLRERLADEVAIFIAPKILGAGVDAIHSLGIVEIGGAIELQKLNRKRIGEDMLITGRLVTAKN